MKREHGSYMEAEHGNSRTATCVGRRFPGRTSRLAASSREQQFQAVVGDEIGREVSRTGRRRRERPGTSVTLAMLENFSVGRVAWNPRPKDYECSLTVRCAEPHRRMSLKSNRRRLLRCGRSLVNHVGCDHGELDRRARITASASRPQRVAAAHAPHSHAVAVPPDPLGRERPGRRRRRRQETSVARSVTVTMLRVAMPSGRPGRCASNGVCPRLTLVGSHAAGSLHGLTADCMRDRSRREGCWQRHWRCATTHPYRVRTRDR
jgi:hypothetical protein